jgi:ferredoxin
VPTIHFRTSGCAVDFDDGAEVNLLRVAIRHDCGVPYRCASGNCGTDKVFVEAGAEHLSPPRPKERDRLGDLLDGGWRLACQTYASGDVTLSWGADGQPALGERAQAKLRDRWLAEPEGGPSEQDEEHRDVG